MQDFVFTVCATTESICKLTNVLFSQTFLDLQQYILYHCQLILLILNYSSVLKKKSLAYCKQSQASTICYGIK